MTKEQVQALRDAGISEAAIIDRILQETAAPEPEKKPDPEPKQPEPEKKQPDPEPKQPEPEPEPDKKPAPQEDKILAAIERLTGAVLNRNVNFTGGDDSITESAADIIGKALRNS